MGLVFRKLFCRSPIRSVRDLITLRITSENPKILISMHSEMKRQPERGVIAQAQSNNIAKMLELILPKFAFKILISTHNPNRNTNNRNNKSNTFFIQTQQNEFQKFQYFALINTGNDPPYTFSQTTNAQKHKTHKHKTTFRNRFCAKIQNR